MAQVKYIALATYQGAHDVGPDGPPLGPRKPASVDISPRADILLEVAHTWIVWFLGDVAVGQEPAPRRGQGAPSPPRGGNTPPGSTPSAVAFAPNPPVSTAATSHDLDAVEVERG